MCLIGEKRMAGASLTSREQMGETWITKMDLPEVFLVSMQSFFVFARNKMDLWPPTSLGLMSHMRPGKSLKAFPVWRGFLSVHFQCD